MPARCWLLCLGLGWWVCDFAVGFCFRLLVWWCPGGGLVADVSVGVFVCFVGLFWDVICLDAVYLSLWGGWCLRLGWWVGFTVFIAFYGLFNYALFVLVLFIVACKLR